MDTTKHRAIAGLIEAGRVQDAWSALNEMLNDNPEDGISLWLLGQCALKSNNYGLAVTVFRRCVALNTDNANTWLSYGTALMETHQFDAAEEVFKKTCQMAGNDPVPWSNLGALYIQRGKPREAMEYAEKALAIVPTYKDAQAIKGFSSLYLRRWKEAWPMYDQMIGGKYRKRRIYRQPEEPTWDGTKGQTVVVQGEQGMGDEISFVSMLPSMIPDCKKVILDTDSRLVNLFKRSFPDIDVYGNRRDKNLEWPLQYEIDAHIHMGSLGNMYRQKDTDFPRKPYLITDPERRAKWKEWLSDKPGLKIGLGWIGGLQHTNRKFRSTVLEEFSRLILPGATYVDLNYKDTFNEVGAWNATHDIQILRPYVDVTDYDDTAALVAELDLVISVTSTVIHLCGAIGKECWTIVPSNPQWRYGLSGEDMIWYPKDSVKLYRQKPGEQGLTHAIGRVADDLAYKLRPRKAA